MVPYSNEIIHIIFLFLFFFLTCRSNHWHLKIFKDTSPGKQNGVMKRGHYVSDLYIQSKIPGGFLAAVERVVEFLGNSWPQNLREGIRRSDLLEMNEEYNTLLDRLAAIVFFLICIAAIAGC